jgi:hypothetical protein
MPIINRGPQPDRPDEDASKAILPKRNGPEPAPPQHFVSPPAPVGKPSNLGGLLAGVLGLCALGAVGYAAYAYVPTMLAQSEHVEVTVDMDIERALRAHGLIELLERKIQQNQRALASAEKSKDQTMADTMRLALGKNLEDLERYQDSYIGSISELHETYAEREGAVLAALKAELQNSEGAMAVGKADAVTEIVALLKSVPQDQPAQSFLSAKLKPQKVSAEQPESN